MRCALTKLHTRLHARRYGLRRQAPKSVELSRWFSETSKLFELQPDSGEIHCPYRSKVCARTHSAAPADSGRVSQRTRTCRLCALQKGLWLDFQESTKEDPVLSKVSRSHFYSVWKTRHSNLKVRKAVRFTVCSLCTEYSEVQLRGGTATTVEENKVKMKVHRKVRAPTLPSHTTRSTLVWPPQPLTPPFARAAASTTQPLRANAIGCHGAAPFL